MTYLKSIDPGLQHLHLPTDETHRATLCGITAGLVETHTGTEAGICTRCCERRYQAETKRIEEQRRAMLRAQV